MFQYSSLAEKPLDQWEIATHWRAFQIQDKSRHCDPHLDQTKFNGLLPLIIAGVLTLWIYPHWKAVFDKCFPSPPFSKDINTNVIYLGNSFTFDMYLESSWIQATAAPEWVAVSTCGRKNVHEIFGTSPKFYEKNDLKIFLAFREWKYLGDICTINGTPVNKVFLKSFEDQGLIGLCA